MLARDCTACNGKRLRPESLSVKFALSRLPLKQLNQLLLPYAADMSLDDLKAKHPELATARQRIAQDHTSRIAALLQLGLGYLSLERSTPSLSPGELQRLCESL